MLELKTPKQLGEESHRLAKTFHLVRHRGTTYMPVDYESGTPAAPGENQRTIWLRLDREQLQGIGASQFSTLFKSDGELANFDFMVAQNAREVYAGSQALLVRTREGLKTLSEGGVLSEPTGDFIPNFVTPILNEDPDDKKIVMDALIRWLDSQEESTSLLHHVATMLSPHWSAVKYVMFLGEGRNGKSVLLKMIAALLGRENVSHVTRQHMSEQSPTVCELSNRLANIVFDGQATFLKDSGTEKSLIAGEPVPIRRLYESTPTLVHTNALFLEGLNREPKSSDKSSALQKRLVRFQFPNVFQQDPGFERLMLSEQTLGAFLSLLIDHMLPEAEFSLLKPTRQAVELRVEHMHTNSKALQFLAHVEFNDEFGVRGLVDTAIAEVAEQFKSWRVSQNDITSWETPDIVQMLQTYFATARKGRRVNGQPRKVRVITALKPDTEAFLATLESEEDGSEIELDPMVGE